MKSIDDFLKDIVETNYKDADDFIKHLGYEQAQLDSFFNKMGREHPGWLRCRKTEGGKVIALGCASKATKWEIEQFLAQGGYNIQHERDEQKREFENENLKLIKAQRKEIDRNSIYSIGSFGVSVFSLLVAAIALIKSC